MLYLELLLEEDKIMSEEEQLLCRAEPGQERI